MLVLGCVLYSVWFTASYYSADIRVIGVGEEVLGCRSAGRVPWRLGCWPGGAFETNARHGVSKLLCSQMRRRSRKAMAGCNECKMCATVRVRRSVLFLSSVTAGIEDRL